MKRKSHVTTIQPARVNLGSFMYYTVISLAALAGITTYSAGAGVEAALLRALMVMLVSTILGYALNIALFISATRQTTPTVLAGRASREIRREPTRHKGLGPGTMQGPEASASTTATASPPDDAALREIEAMAEAIADEGKPGPESRARHDQEAMS